jgi:hypothetical protein
VLPTVDDPVTFAQRISPRTALLLVAVLLVAQAAILLTMGRVPICTCGYVKFWHGTVHSSENSQHIFDWYSFTHVIHGFLFYFLGWLMLRRSPIALRLVLAVLVEGSWELFENSEFVINRYRTATISFDYFGDSVVNSVSDTIAMIVGFGLASRLPALMTIALAVIVEVALAYLIHDNFTLNIVMIVYPLEAIKSWQAIAPLQ